jgi:hypothetical protein
MSNAYNSKHPQAKSEPNAIASYPIYPFILLPPLYFPFSLLIEPRVHPLLHVGELWRQRWQILHLLKTAIVTCPSGRPA